MPATKKRRKAETAQQLAELPLVGFVRIAQLIPGILPFSPATLYRMVRRGTFPKPLKLSENISAWKVEDIRAWMDAQQAPGMEPEGKAA